MARPDDSPSAGLRPVDEPKPPSAEHPQADQHYRALFAAHGLRCTRQRLVVYDALLATRSHPTAEAIYEAVRHRVGDSGISLATVYNTLETLCQCGLCRKLATPGGPTRFDAITDEHAHVQTPDGALLDLPADLSCRLLASVRDPELLAEVERRMGVRIDRISVHLTAQPPDARDQADPSPAEHG